MYYDEVRSTYILLASSSYSMNMKFVASQLVASSSQGGFSAFAPSTGHYVGLLGAPCLQ